MSFSKSSKLAFFTGSFGWLLPLAYLYYDYGEYGTDLFRHLITVDSFAELFFHVIILTAPIGSTITAYLINERKKLLDKTAESEKQLKHLTAEWRATFDAMPYGVLLTDNNYNIIRANNYIARLAGISVKELGYNRKCYNLVHRMDTPPDNCALSKSVKTQQTVTIDFYDKQKDKYFVESVTPLLSEEGTDIAYIHVLVDMTDVLQKETKLVHARDAFFSMLKDLDATYKELKGVYNSLVGAFAKMIDAKSHWTNGHSERVTNYALAIARELGLSQHEMDILRTAGLLHDIGKIGLYDIVLDKPFELTREEWEEVKKHPAKGEEMLRSIKGLDIILPVIRHHHERMDGEGYPDRLNGEEIPFLARIICVADAFDSMTSDRPYRPAPRLDYAIEELRQCSGTQFDQNIVDAFLRILGKNDGVFQQNGIQEVVSETS